MKKIIVILILALTLICNTADADRFFNLFLPRIGGTDPITSGQVTVLGKFDIVVMNKAHYNDVGGSPTSTRYNANATTFNLIDDEWNSNGISGKIFTYTTSAHSSTTHDGSSFEAINSLDHYGTDRGTHSGGSITDHDTCCGVGDYLLRDSAGGTVSIVTLSTFKMISFGNPATQTWAYEALSDIFIGYDYTADGIYSDHNWCCEDGQTYGAGQLEASYDSNTEWAAEMNEYMTGIANYLSGYGQLYIGNRGPIQLDLADCVTAWEDQGDSATPMFGQLSEVSFATGEGDSDPPGAPCSTNEAQFFPPATWVYFMEAMAVTGSAGIMNTDSKDLGPSFSDSGCSNLGHPVTYGQLLFYQIGSFAMGKQSNSYFGHGRRPGEDYNDVTWSPVFDEMDPEGNLHLGNSVTSYTPVVVDKEGGGTLTVYKREFDKGFVYVNPQWASYPATANAIDIPLDEDCKILTSANYSDDMDLMSSVSTFDLDSHYAVWAYKESAMQSAQPFLSGGAVSAGSVKQITP